jgi:hypothetical protein
VSRQFTDGEIVAAIKGIAAEGAPLSRAAVRKRLGGGGSNRISAMLKDFRGAAHEAPPALGPAEVSAAAPVHANGATPPAASPPPVAAVPASSIERETDSSVAHLQSEIRVLKILLESERDARRDDEARYSRTIEALQREIEIAGHGWPDWDTEKGKKDPS